MYSNSSTAKRALLACRWQLPNVRDYPVLEVNPGELVVVHPEDLVGGIVGDPEKMTHDVPLFEHDLLTDAKNVNTYAGYLACHAMWPFDPRSGGKSVSLVLGVHEVGEDFRVVQVTPNRIQVAYSDISYVSPTDQGFVRILARSSKELPRADVFHDNAR